ncbi:DUF1488 domain-containing protein [Burkholderia pyrrocinia]|uniref:DUF1488 domain-containing protein n=1 Tax=Burkholderia TaxID=32008 RepID=UPI0021AC1139|nr:DUF1488 domain-containing protein [Burkholderia pyrrocinia]
MRFTVDVDGQPEPCAITAEALDDHFGARCKPTCVTRSGAVGPYAPVRPLLDAAGRRLRPSSNTAALPARSGGSARTRRLLGFDGRRRMSL